MKSPKVTLCGLMGYKPSINKNKNSFGQNERSAKGVLGGLDDVCISFRLKAGNVPRGAAPYPGGLAPPRTLPDVRRLTMLPRLGLPEHSVAQSRGPC